MDTLFCSSFLAVTSFLRLSNASLQLLPEAGAERTLEAVSCKALFGHLTLMYGEADCDPGAAPCGYSEARHAPQEGIG